MLCALCVIRYNKLTYTTYVWMKNSTRSNVEQSGRAAGSIARVRHGNCFPSNFCYFFFLFFNGSFCLFCVHQENRKKNKKNERSTNESMWNTHCIWVNGLAVAVCARIYTPHVIHSDLNCDVYASDRCEYFRFIDAIHLFGCAIARRSWYIQSVGANCVLWLIFYSDFLIA